MFLVIVMSENRLISSVSDIAEAQIGEEYITENEVQVYIQDSDKFLCVTGVVEGRHVCTEVTDESIEFDTVTGFIRGRIVESDVFTTDRFNLPEVDSNTIFEVLTWAVSREYQGNHLGVALTNKMAYCILESDCFPVISPVRKPQSNSTDHLEFLAQYGSTVKTVDEKPESVNCAICNGSCTCQTVILKYNRGKITELHKDTRGLLDENIKLI